MFGFSISHRAVCLNSSYHSRISEEGIRTPREPLVFKQRLDALLQASKAVSMWMGRDPQKPEFYIFEAWLRGVSERGLPNDPDLRIGGGLQRTNLALVLSVNFAGFPQRVRHFASPDPARWDEAKVPVKIDLIRPKTDYRYYTFLHRDAIAGLKAHLSSRGIPRSRQANDPRRLPTS